MSNLPAGAALLEANAGLFLSLPPQPDPPPAPQSMVDLAGTTLSSGATVAILAADMLASVHPQLLAEQAMAQREQQAEQAEQPQQQQHHQQQQAEQAEQPQQQQHHQQQHAEQAQQQQQQQAQQAQQQQQQQQQAAAGGLGEPALQLAAAVLQKHHWLMSEMVAAAAGEAQAGGMGQCCIDLAVADVYVYLRSWLRAADWLSNVLQEVPILPLHVSSGAAFCAGAAAAEAVLRLQPLPPQLNEALGLETEVPPLVSSCLQCRLVTRWLAGAVLPASDMAPDCFADANAARAACQLASCAAKYAWWAMQQVAGLNSGSSSMSGSCGATTGTTGGGSSGSGSSVAASGSAQAVVASSPSEDARKEAVDMPRLLALLAFTSAAHLAVVAASQHPEDERLQM